MKERIDNETPLIIRNLLAFPYYFFSTMFTGPLVLLDIASGFSRGISQQYFKRTIAVDINALARSDDSETQVIPGDIRNIPLKDKSVDVTFSFETIEHIREQSVAVRELLRVTKKVVVIGSVNRDGPNWIEGVEIYKGNRNPFHVKELGCEEFRLLLTQEFNRSIEFFGSYYGLLSREFEMREESFAEKQPYCYCNYGVIKLEGI